MSNTDFVEKIGELAVKDMHGCGILASVTIAQAILESGYGSTELAQNANNLFGMKTSLSGNTWSGTTWDGDVYTKRTAEYDRNGNKYYITADFRKYVNIEASIRDHSAYLLGAKNSNGFRYAGLQGEQDFESAVRIIKNGGYATDTAYVSKLLSIYNQWDLGRFDSEYKGVVSLRIHKMITKKCCYVGRNRPAYIVVHETDNWSKGAGAKTHANAMYNGNLAGTVHYYVDSSATYQTLDHGDGAWAVGDGHGKYGITNLNSINIEICVNPESDYYVAVDKCAVLCAKLLGDYGWGIERLKRHYDASRKHCPRRIIDEGLWDSFSSKVMAYMHGTSGNVNGWLEIGDRGTEVKRLQADLNKLGITDGSGNKLIEDGVFGEKTDHAVRQFQTMHGLSVDGQAGVKTKEKIKALLSGNAESGGLKYFVQAGAFKHKAKAQELVNNLKAAGFSAIIKDQIGKETVPGVKYYVQAGAYKNKEKAQSLIEELKAAGFDGIIKEME